MSGVGRGGVDGGVVRGDEGRGGGEGGREAVVVGVRGCLPVAGWVFRGEAAGMVAGDSVGRGDGVPAGGVGGDAEDTLRGDDDLRGNRRGNRAAAGRGQDVGAGGRGGGGVESDMHHHPMPPCRGGGWGAHGVWRGDAQQEGAAGVGEEGGG